MADFNEYVLILNADDSVGVARRFVPDGLELANGSLRIKSASAINQGHKIALKELAEGEAAKKYGQIIGFAKMPIRTSALVHTHNLGIKEFGRDYQFCSDARPVEYH